MISAEKQKRAKIGAFSFVMPAWDRPRLPTDLAAVAAITTIAASAAVTPTTAESATAFRAGLRLRLIHADGPAVERLPVECVNRRLGLFAVRHLDEAKTL
jgi:hypothetical protein